MGLTRRAFIRMAVGTVAARAAFGRASVGNSIARAEAVVVKPRAIDDLLANPGMGWQTFGRFADEDPNLDGLPSGSAYFRFYWNKLEPKEGQIDFAFLDGLLTHARKAGQKLALRVACVRPGGEDYATVPAWLKDAGCRGFDFRRRGADTNHWAPDFEDPLFQRAHFKFLSELGKRYDGHPDLDLMDIGSVGLFGEWHMSGTGVAMPTPAMRLKIIDAYCQAFPRTPKVMLVNDVGGLTHAVPHGCGWRADCLGDMGGFSKTWNHMENMYRQHVKEANAGEGWKAAPVAFESCWDMRKWKTEGWDIRKIFDYALDLHASYLNNKSAPIPEGTRPEVERFIRKLGYRLVMRRVEYPRAVRAGERMTLQTAWENLGVAPPYRGDLLAVRLTDGNGQRTVIASASSIRGWLPGKREIAAGFEVPAKLPAGARELAIGVIEGATSEPIVRLANAGRDAEGWYPLGRIEIAGA